MWYNHFKEDLTLFIEIAQHILHKFDDSEAQNNLGRDVSSISGHLEMEVLTNVSKIKNSLILDERDGGCLYELCQLTMHIPCNPPLHCFNFYQISIFLTDLGWSKFK